jgi:hypothetical protein
VNICVRPGIGEEYSAVCFNICKGIDEMREFLRRDVLWEILPGIYVLFKRQPKHMASMIFRLMLTQFPK